MELFKYLLFGIAGLSMIFWTCVIAFWHTYMFPRIFSEDYLQNNSFKIYKSLSLGSKKSAGLIDRDKYSNRSFVIADFNPIESGYGVNRLFITILLSLAIMSFIIISYGLQSGFKLYGLA